MNYLMPFKGVLPMHCAANVDEDGKNTTLFFGLSGTGKTTLSSDENRLLIGDDEHCWTDTGISNIEGGCYAKCIDPPANIKKCITFGALLENLVYDDETRAVDYHDESITANTRASYPLSNISNILMPCIAEAPKNIIFLTCDAYGGHTDMSALSIFFARSSTYMVGLSGRNTSPKQAENVAVGSVMPASVLGAFEVYPLIK
jgi:phosphoenolpyruvate carboxykinase (ATP)